MIRLRPHHLLCMLTYVGKGYTPRFTENFDQLTRQMASGNELVEVVSGPDDVCAPLLGEEICHCLKESVFERDRMAAMEIGVLLDRPISAGEQIELTTPLLEQLRGAFRTGAIRSACRTCPWKELCDGVAASGFDGTLLAGSPGPASCHP